MIYKICCNILIVFFLFLFVLALSARADKIVEFGSTIINEKCVAGYRICMDESLSECTAWEPLGAFDTCAQAKKFVDEFSEDLQNEFPPKDPTPPRKYKAPKNPTPAPTRALLQANC